MKETSLFDYSDFRQYLADSYAQKKRANPGYSHRVFAKQAGLSSPSHLLMIIRGERNLSMKTIEKFAQGLKLTTKEKRYFELLVLLNQTEDLTLKAKYFSDIMMMKLAAKKLHKLEKEKFEFLSNWYVVAIYVLTDLADFHNDPHWIAKRLGGKITSSQVREALETLQKLGLLDESFRQVAGAVTVPDDTKSVAVFQYHRSMIALANEALRLLPVQEREMAGATIAVPKSKLPEIKEKIRAFRQELNRLASSYENPDEIYQLNIQLFPLTTGEK